LRLSLNLPNVQLWRGAFRTNASGYGVAVEQCCQTSSNVTSAPQACGPSCCGGTEGATSTPASAVEIVACDDARPLAKLREGQTGVICESRLAPGDASMLRAMGLCLHATVRICKSGSPCIVAVAGLNGKCHCGGSCRIGLARALAERIFVRAV
jgi:Fe2+ transport system protein FeoA